MQESIIGSVCVHHGVGPDSSSMKDATLGSDSFLDALDELHIGVVVLFQELKIELISQLTLQDHSDLGHSFLYEILILSVVFYFCSDELQDFGLESLVFFVANIKGNLIGIQVLVSVWDFNQFFEK